MLAFLKSVMGKLKEGTKDKPAPARRSVRPGLECLEDRQLLSASIGSALSMPALANFNSPIVRAPLTTQGNSSIPIDPAVFPHQASRSIFVNPKVVGQMVDLTGVKFDMANLDVNLFSYQLRISSETINPDGTANFYGQWTTLNDKTSPVYGVAGTLAYDASGDIHIKFSFRGDTFFDGTIKGQPGSYSINGYLTGPGHDSGFRDLPGHYIGIQE
jgi:hypothetical protein